METVRESSSMQFSTTSRSSKRVSDWRERVNYRRLRRARWATGAMSTRRRCLLRINQFLTCCRDSNDDTTASNQYRIPPKSETRESLSSFIDALCLKFSFWIYRTTFLKAIVGFFIFFLIIIHFFALLLWGFVAIYYRRHGQEHCLSGWLVESPYSFSHNFVVAFAASWQTFVTVGYGAVAPPDDVSHVYKCCSVRVSPSFMTHIPHYCVV